MSAPATDLRLYHADQKAPRLEALTDLSARLARGASAALRVGVSREWTKLDESALCHWVQANGLHMGDKPTWSQMQIERTYGRATTVGGLDKIPF